ncbi:uncharacterized protein LOC124368637 [Homalodisca vitripennis]|uniref:uncharacterized protein LOC124368637 n=1 Tax=Homalodisca vitripennis TaxID=197043 RepID=UPI001EEC4E9B|nr:uncharacterized protein LOC124368637 [Homalodisca vitripennis]
MWLSEGVRGEVRALNLSPVSLHLGQQSHDRHLFQNHMNPSWHSGRCRVTNEQDLVSDPYQSFDPPAESRGVASGGRTSGSKVGDDANGNWCLATVARLVRYFRAARERLRQTASNPYLKRTIPEVTLQPHQEASAESNSFELGHQVFMAYTIKSFGEFWEPLGRLEVRLDAGLYDLFRGLRSLLLATHWHTFTLMYTGLPLRRDAADILRSPPLLPRFIPLREDAARHAIFRLLSDVSHSTKGVVLLMMDGHTTKRVMDEAQKLNMVLGNFVWLWIDTTATISAHNDSKLSIFYPEDTSRSKDRRARESGDNDHPYDRCRLYKLYF